MVAERAIYMSRVQYNVYLDQIISRLQYATYQPPRKKKDKVLLKVILKYIKNYRVIIKVHKF